MTQLEVATAIGVKQNTISEYESGIISPRVDKLKAMAELFSCSVDELLNDRG